MNIFLAPISGKELFFNYNKTVVNGISYSLKLPKEIPQSRTVRLWGIKNAKVSSYYKANNGDILMFYHKGQIIGAAKIMGKFRDVKLSQELWGAEFDSFRNCHFYWENILVLSEFRHLSFDFDVIIKLAEYKPKACVRGFILSNEKLVSNIITNYSSIDNFYNKVSKMKPL